MQRCEKSQKADDRGVSRPAGETMKRELRQIIDLDDGEDADYDFLSQVADAESRALSSKAAAKRARPSFTAADDAGEVKPQVKGAYLAALRGDDATGRWREQQSKSAGAGSRLKVVAADGANVGGDRLGLGGGGGDNACFKCGKLGHWARDCDGAPVGGGAQSSEPQKACPCGLGDCLVLTANTEKNRGRRFYKCPVREENGGCGFFEWCDNASGATYMPNMSFDSRSSSQFPDLLCPCGAGSCLILTAKTGKNVGQQFYRCPANQGSSCGYFKWCNYHTAVASLPASAGKVYNSFNDMGGKSYGTPSGSSCVKRGEEGHWAKDCSLPAPDYSSASSGTGKSSAPGSCYKCGEAGHWAKDCLSPNYEGRKAITMSKAGHWANDCLSPNNEGRKAITMSKAGHWAKDCLPPNNEERKAITMWQRK
ncbi:uncharacterized protein LOC115667483 [Syzygium oleosum]|uniref:uncharacterized protein LOC115667483 n=1 Tax=Syzygium oleosum TaxID=219896 RepID=UPI0024B9BAF4|nr:uncharacterized protein LOC115667483 [Syzygium oleosum]